jgi:hypothetical protein
MNLSLSDAVPMDLKIECGVGKYFELYDLLTGLDVQSGVGEATGFDRRQKRDLHAMSEVLANHVMAS